MSKLKKQLYHYFETAAIDDSCIKRKHVQIFLRDNYNMKEYEYMTDSFCTSPLKGCIRLCTQRKLAPLFILLLSLLAGSFLPVFADERSSFIHKEALHSTLNPSNLSQLVFLPSLLFR